MNKNNQKKKQYQLRNLQYNNSHNNSSLLNKLKIDFHLVIVKDTLYDIFHSLLRYNIYIINYSIINFITFMTYITIYFSFYNFIVK